MQRFLRITDIRGQKNVDVGALAKEELNNKYPHLYKQFRDGVGLQYIGEFVCVTWIRDSKWHGQEDGFYHRSRFEQINKGRSIAVLNSKMFN